MAHGPQGCWLVEPLPISGPKCDTGVTPLTSWGPDWKMGLPQGGSDLRWQGSQGSVSVPWPTKRYHDFFEVYIVLCVHLFCSIYIYLSNLLPIPTYLSILSERKRERERTREGKRGRETQIKQTVFVVPYGNQHMERCAAGSGGRRVASAIINMDWVETPPSSAVQRKTAAFPGCWAQRTCLKMWCWPRWLIDRLNMS